MNAAAKASITTLCGILLFGSIMSPMTGAAPSELVRQSTAKKAAEKAPTAEEKEFIKSEIKRVQALINDPSDVYIMVFNKFKQLNNGVPFRPFSDYKGNRFTTYEDYAKRISHFNGPVLQQPSNMPEGYKLVSARIEIPFEGKFFDDLLEEGKKSGKAVYIKKMDWKEVGRVHLTYTNGKDEISIDQYTAGPDYLKLKGFVFEHPYDKKRKKGPDPNTPKYVFWYGTGKYYYSISTKSDMTKEQMIEVLKAAVKK
ncbi:hypothetical protein [Paenibacillus agilis]|uniref:DUF4367 domain-containing protein n=1 Tax=Paenibacillus agilis TaxID=3020863 RepID=A0A559IHF4_9BACL|nr:hypothetical protein [Paenibacillus agilis]TVX87068.1 hypothetical protein FPZ44_21435 [Paenibacillus agilis]